MQQHVGGERTRFGCFLLAAAVLSSGRSTWGADVIFRDDFNDPQLVAGWAFLREDPASRSLTERPGFLRILTERGAFDAEQEVRNLLLRPVSGDFIIEAELEFDPRRANELGGILVFVDDDNVVALGLAYASGARGVFRGVVLLSVSGGVGDAQRPFAFYDDDSAENPAVVYLRLLRSGDQFVAGYSPDGVTYADIGSVTNPLAGAVQVGVGAGNGDYAECGADCDLPIPADFDFFQISRFGEGDGGEAVGLESVAIDGAEEMESGGTTEFTVSAELSDGTSLDVTDEVEWTVAPQGFGAFEGGSFVAANVVETVQVTIVATFTLLSSGGGVSRTDSQVLRIAAPAPPTGGPQGCQPGPAAAMLTLFGLWTFSLAGRNRFLSRRFHGS